ncbi:hypothetical protein F5X99DRAFT_210431 [Biscogniauxia marginata]|nr:hypothetical protein F5X99DRAFT_210431 [Biscogniauxia marginata]
MSVLAIPDAGLQLDSSSSSRDFLPMQAFGITLNDSVIEDMIKCFQKGKDIELTLGSNPSFHYGSKELDVSATPESFDYDLYLTNLEDSTTKAERLPNPTMSIWKKPPNLSSAQSKRADKASKGAKQASRASSSGAESDGDTLASSYARADAQKNGNTYDVADPASEAELTHDRTKIVNGIPRDAKRGGGGKGKLLPTGRSAMATVLSSTTTRSLPTSPSLNGVSSPNPAFSASQQLLEKNKGQRFALVHELAARDRTLEYLKDVWMGPEEEFQSTLEKVSSYEASIDKYSLKKMYWKELDVWNYDYDNPEDRQAAIDNAIKQYDKQRTGTSDPAWERLLAPDDRGKGIILSKLQATLAKGNITPAPRIAVQKPEDGSKSDADSKAKGEAMSRSNSQPTSNKPKKVSEREAQTKRLLSSNPKKPAPKKPTSKVKAAEEKGKRVLSEEFVYDSDSSGDEPPLSQNISTAPKPKPVERPVEKVAEKPKPSPAPSPAPAPTAKPKPKPVVRAPRAPVKASATTNSSQKRTREDDDSSSSSGAPLSKRIKPKELPRPVSDARATKHRASDASQNSRGTGTTGAGSSSFSIKSKNTSPAKSSPLASSPPTNASDLDEQPPPPSSQNHRPHTQSHQTPHSRNGEHNGERERECERDHGHTNGVTNGTSTSTSITSSSSASSTVVVNPTKKRKDRDFPTTDSQTPSRQQESTPPSNGSNVGNKKPRVSKDVLIQARKFTRYYEKYESLHYEIAALKEPPEDKLADLLEMRERLVNMKSEISRAVASGA